MHYAILTGIFGQRDSIKICPVTMITERLLCAGTVDEVPASAGYRHRPKKLI